MKESHRQRAIDVKNEPGRATALTPVRTLDGIAYWVIDDPADIKDYIDVVLRKEWEADIEDDGPPKEDWLGDLLHRSWSLEVLGVDQVHGSEYLGSPRLAQRRAELRRGIERYGSVIWPIVVWEEEHFLADGYCRYTTLKEMGVKRVYAYVGVSQRPGGGGAGPIRSTRRSGRRGAFPTGVFGRINITDLLTVFDPASEVA
jgi:hypothetical protein